MEELAPDDPHTPDFDTLMGDLAKLSRNHLMFFRIEVGRRLSAAFYGHDPARYRKASGVKGSSFHRFVTERAAQLADLGLSEHGLRMSLLAFFAVKDLPGELLDGLVYSQVLELGRVEDLRTRTLLARAAVDNAWNGVALANAVLLVRAGRWPDGDPTEPGLQPVPEPAPTPARRPHPGRVVTRFERTADDLEALLGQWQQVPVERLTRLQRARVHDALTRAESRLAALKERLRSE